MVTRVMPVDATGLDMLIQARGGGTAFRQWGQDFLFISFTACSPNFSGGNYIVLPPQPHLSGGKLPPLPYGGAAHDPARRVALVNNPAESVLI